MVHVNESKCIGCAACIRSCPIANANIYENNVVKVDNDACIQCGECIKVCPHGARYYDDDLEQVLALIKSSQKVSFIVAPAIKASMDGTWRHVLQWFKEQGVHEIYDGAFGADICTYMHIQHFKKFPESKLISQPCAAIVNYAEKHKPGLLEHLSPIQSPLMCAAIYVRKYLNNNDTLVGITPCIAKSDEFRNTGVISYNVTFKNIVRYMRKNNVLLPHGRSPFEFSATRGYDGAFYPNPGGLKDCLHAYDPDLMVSTSEGAGKVYDDLDRYIESDKHHLPSVYDVLSCEFGCNTGVGARDNVNSFTAGDIMSNAKKWAVKSRLSDRFHRRIFKNLKTEDFVRTYQNRCNYTAPSEHDLDEVFKKMLKVTDADKHVDCSACGFKSCHDMAKAIYYGKNTVDNCIVYERTNLREMATKINAQNEKLSLAVDEINQAMETLSEKVRPILSQAQENSVKNSNIKSDMNTLEDNIQGIQDQSSGITDFVNKIGVSINEYERILGKIKSISEQTNILAINASIEAASAGQFGKGFAVVAGEIRTLAVKSADTVKAAERHTRQILENIDGIKDSSANIISDVDGTKVNVDNTDQAVNDLNKSLEFISSSVSEITDIIAQVTTLALSLKE